MRGYRHGHRDTARRIVAPKHSSGNIFIASFEQGVNAYKDKSVISPRTAQRVYNFCFDTGVLSDGYGIAESSVIERNPLAKVAPNEIVDRVWYFAKREPNVAMFLMIATKSGRIYYKDTYKGTGFELLEGIVLSSTPSALAYRLYEDDVIIITSSSDGMYVWNGFSDVQQIEGVPNITSMTMHFERMFVTTPDYPDTIWFSEDLDPTNFTLDLDEGGYIEMVDDRGMPLSTVSYQNYVYIFREYGISRLVAYGAQEEFALSNLFVSSGRIYPSSVCICGDAVMFLASDGIYAFNGISVRKILDNISPLIRPSRSAVSQYFEGKYYLSLVMDFGDDAKVGCEIGEYVNNALIVVDITTGAYSISRGLDITSLRSFAAYGEIVAVGSGGDVGIISKTGAVFDVPLKKSWSSGVIDMNNPCTTKRIRQIDVVSHKDIRITMHTNGGANKTIAVKGGTDIRRILAPLVCKSVEIDFECSSSGSYISRPKISYDV